MGICQSGLGKIKNFSNKIKIDNLIETFIISPSLFYNYFVRNLKKISSSENTNEFLDISDNENSLGIVRIIKYNEEIFEKKNLNELKLKYNEKTIILSDNNDNSKFLNEETFKKYKKLIDFFKSNKIKISKILILSFNLKGFLEEFNFFNNSKENLQISIDFNFPILVFDSNDFLPRKYKYQLRLFMQKHIDYNKNIERDANFFANIGIKDVVPVTNLFISKDQIEYFSLDHEFGFEQALGKLTSSIFSKKKRSCVIIHSSNSEEILLVVKLVFNFLKKKINLKNEIIIEYLQNIFPEIDMNYKNLKINPIYLIDKEENFETELNENIQLFKKESDKWIESIQVILSILDKIIENPNDSDLKNLKKSDDELYNCIFQYNFGNEILRLCGFVNNKINENILTNYLSNDMILDVKNKLEKIFKLCF